MMQYPGGLSGVYMKPRFPKNLHRVLLMLGMAFLAMPPVPALRAEDQSTTDDEQAQQPEEEEQPQQLPPMRVPGMTGTTPMARPVGAPPMGRFPPAGAQSGERLDKSGPMRRLPMEKRATGIEKDPGSRKITGEPASSSRSSGEESQARPDEDRQRPPILDPNAMVTIDFVDTDISDLIKYMAEITGRNFILGDKLSGKVTIISHEQVTVAAAYEAFLSALEVAGYTTVTIGKATKVLKSADAARAPLRVYQGDSVPYTDNFVTQIIQPDNVSVKDILTVVKELASSSGRVIAYSPTNTLILTDSATNIRRIYRIINDLDVAAPTSSIKIIRLTYADAASLEAIIEELYGVEASSSTSQETTTSRRRRSSSRRSSRNVEESRAEASATSVGEGGYIAKVITDERTNSLIIQANDEAMSDITELIRDLDTYVDPASRSQIHVVYLEHAKAEDVAQVLSNLSSSASSYGSSSSRNLGNRSSRSGRMGNSSSRTGTSSRAGVPGMMGSAGSYNKTKTSSKSTGVMAAFESGLSVASDENTNSLVIIAAPEDFRIIKQVIDKLDIRRKQVFVEAVILEMASDETFDIGLGYHVGNASDSGALSAYSAQLNGYSLGLSSADLLSGLAMGVFGEAIDISVADDEGTTTSMSVPAFGIALNALQSQSAVNILSTPNILTMDNEEAKIIVGRNIPFPTSTGRDSNNNPIISYQREDVAITLKVTPQINESNFVTLEVFQEVSEIEEDSQGLDVSSAGFITSKRSAETVVVVRDNQTVVVGGLIANTSTQVETKIPILGDMPLLGLLFRGTRDSSRKTNLLIFLTPHVIDSPEDLEEIYRIKVAQRAEFMRRFYGKSQQEQNDEIFSLLRYSMNLVDEPSVYRTKVDQHSMTTTIDNSTGDFLPTEGLEPYQEPESGLEEEPRGDEELQGELPDGEPGAAPSQQPLDGEGN